MEMTMPHLNETAPADFTYRAASLRSYAPMPIITGVLFGLLAGPSNALACPVTGPWAHKPTAHAPAQVDASAMVAPAAELITQIKEGWQFNMTELADLMGVQRPTLYNWQNGKTSPDAEKIQRLQVIAAAARVWNEHTNTAEKGFLLDYLGPLANELSIRQHLTSPKTTIDELRELIPACVAQSRKAREEVRAMLGEALPLPVTSPPAAARRMNAAWAKNTKALHAARNRNL
jgi:transcriptional regulator with XRE-family HTH domain